MSFLQYPEAVNAPVLQVWNNAAFHSEESGGFSVPMKTSGSSLHPVFENQSESFDSDSSKENLTPAMVNSPVSVQSSIPIKPFHSNGVTGKSQIKLSNLLAKNGGSVEISSVICKKGCEQEDGKAREEKKIDAEIEKIENEIKRLSSRLEALRLEKAEQNVKTIERRGRIVPAKFMEAKQSVKISEVVKKIEEPPLSSSRVKLNRRGVSLGPAEIFAGVRSRPPGKLDITPVQPIHSRRKSCFWKLQDIEEGKAVRERRKSLTLSPKSRKTLSKMEAQKQAATTVGFKKCVKKEAGVLSLIQPRKLFKDGENQKSVPAKKPLKPGRVVASRYNQISNPGSSSAIDPRKRSWPENDKDEGKIREKRRASSVGKSRANQGTEGRIKKRWEIPPEIVIYRSEEEEKNKLLSSSSMAEMTDLLPKIKITRFVNESPRGSGPAKRVAELMGKRSYFCPDEDGSASSCQALSFAEEEEEGGDEARWQEM